MALVFEKKKSGPGTHALIVASGDIPRYPVSGSVSPSLTGGRIADWLISDFRHPDAGIASVDFLAATPKGEGRYVRPGTTSAVPLEPARFGAFKAAMERWRARLDSNPDNIAFFYYAGYVFDTPETQLPLQDFATKAGGTVSLPSFLQAMRGCRANRHLYIVDGIDLPFGSAVAAPRPQTFAAAKPRVQLGWAMIRGETPDSDEVSAFARALLQVLEPPRGASPLYFSDVIQRLPAMLEGTGARLPETELRGDVPFHYPAPDPESPGDGAPDGGEKPAPKPARKTGKTSKPGPSAARKAGQRATAGSAAATLAAQSSAVADNAAVLSAVESAVVAAAAAESAALAAGSAAATARSSAATEDAGDETDSDFVPDDAEAERDRLGRAGLAIALARKLHQIWRKTNETPPQGGVESRAAFVVHLDAPWGGGKTTFANFVGRVLNPCPPGERPALFLRQNFPGADVGGIFLAAPPHDDEAAGLLAALPGDSRRPWIVVPFNAWQAEHCAPPWWVFYQAIRKGCFDAIWREGDGAWRPRAPGRGPWRARLDRLRRSVRARLGGKIAWFALVIGEYGWRLLNPKIFSLIATALFGVAMLLVLKQYGAWGTLASGGAGFVLTSGAGLVAAGLTGVGAIWGLGALFTESIIPGTNGLAERLSLGNGDPFARFRTHFARTMEGVRRPVMVVVDDLDRCRPDFVVDLIRGIQTLLRSPRVVFVILGDRDWIERAFEAHHQAMKTVDVGPEQSFGARFVEKAIQMSFLLPAMGDKAQLDYLRRVLLGDDAAEGGGAPALTEKAAAGLNEVLTRAVAAPRVDPIVSDEELQQVVDEVAKFQDRDADAPAVSAPELAQMLNERLAGHVVVNKQVEVDATHQLEPLARYFPANPRQIKRIVNAITLYFAVAVALQREREGLVPDRAFLSQLALWVVIMTEWPETWRLLASFPGLVDMLADMQPPPGTRPPGSDAMIGAALDRIRADGKLAALITGIGEDGERSHDRLETGYAAILADLTPLHSRKHRLPGESGEPKAAAPERVEKPPSAAKRAAPEPRKAK